DDDDEAADARRATKRRGKVGIASEGPVIAGPTIDESKGPIPDRREIEGGATHVAVRHAGEKVRRQNRQLAEHERKRKLLARKAYHEGGVVDRGRRINHGEVRGSRVAGAGIPRRVD